MPHTSPVPQTERIDSLDTLRGFALLGILVMNIQSFAMPGTAYMNPTSYGDLHGVNYWVWFLGRVLADQKFMTIFSMLFGAGIILFTTRVKAAGGSPLRMHYRRTFWLLVLGLAHAYLLWYGDILVLYSICALVLYPARKLFPRWQLALGLFLLSMGSAISVFGGLTLDYWPPEQSKEMKESAWQPTPELLKVELAAYRGPWVGQLAHRVPESLEFETANTFYWGFWRAGGLMLVGMALYRWGVFSAALSSGNYITMAVVGFLVGVPLIIYGIQRDFVTGWDFRTSFFFNEQCNYWGSVFVSMAYVGFVMLIFKSGAIAFFTRRLRAVGQMAFTNYLMHTLTCCMIFYGPGLGLFGDVSRLGQILIVFAIWIAQLIYSPLWLKYFRFGPFEWLWRSLTYWSLQPMRRATA